MKKPVQFLIFLLLFTPIFAQEQSSEETVEETAVSSTVEEPDTKQDENLEGLNSAIEKIKSLPFSFDIGCEPELNGSKTFTTFRYSWSPKYYTILDLSFTSKMQEHDEISVDNKNYMTTKSNIKSFEIGIEPMSIKYFIKSNENMYISINPGFKYTWTKTNTSTSRIIFPQAPLEASLGLIETDSIMHNFMPYFAVNVKYPLHKYISLNGTFTVAPAFGSVTNYDITVSTPLAATPQTSSASNTSTKFSTPYFDATIHLDFFNFIALVTSCNYMKTTYDAFEDSMSHDNNRTYSTINWRIGGCFINLGHAGFRFKSGMYYEHTWEKTPTTNNSFIDYGKWIIGVSTMEAR